MIFFYKLIAYIFFILILPFLPFVYFFSEKRRSNLLQRFGFRTGLTLKKEGEKRIWIHALSVGEVISAVPFVAALKDRHKELDIVFTASTKTGFDMAEQLFMGENTPHINQLGYFPFDLGFSVKKISRLINPDTVILVETDLWPTFLYEMKQKRIPVLLINARLSSRSLKGYLLFKQFSLQFFSMLTVIMAQTPLDKKRFQRLGIDAGNIYIAGNIKFDQPRENMDITDMDVIRKRFGAQEKTHVFVAGSTHEGEEIILCSVYKKLKKIFPEGLMILAPRDPKRCRQILSYFRVNGVGSVLLSEMDRSKPVPDVVLVNKIGELQRLYAICNAAFVGGSMVEQGGHNPLEPAAFSKPILFGTDMSDFQLISAWLLAHGGAVTVTSEKDLYEQLERILKDPRVQVDMGRHNHEVFLRNSGAVQRIIKHMECLSIV